MELELWFRQRNIIGIPARLLARPRPPSPAVNHNYHRVRFYSNGNSLGRGRCIVNNAIGQGRWAGRKGTGHLSVDETESVPLVARRERRPEGLEGEARG